ncbi:MAG: HU family DNA-binding protein [Bacteroidales bacterium]|jgi:DNA-binding protein HU-beta|nr:HU family DNA-binding protein [Bacteroidales bacterium]
MNKIELIAAIAEKADVTKVQARKNLEAFLDVATDVLRKGDKIFLAGFGTFSVVKRSARKGRNPQTKKEMTIPAKNIVKFKAGAELNATV